MDIRSSLVCMLLKGGLVDALPNARHCPSQVRAADNTTVSGSRVKTGALSGVAIADTQPVSFSDWR